MQLSSHNVSCLLFPLGPWRFTNRVVHRVFQTKITNACSFSTNSNRRRRFVSGFDFTDSLWRGNIVCRPCLRFVSFLHIYIKNYVWEYIAIYAFLAWKSGWNFLTRSDLSSDSLSERPRLLRGSKGENPFLFYFGDDIVGSFHWFSAEST